MGYLQQNYNHICTVGDGIIVLFSRKSIVLEILLRGGDEADFWASAS